MADMTEHHQTSRGDAGGLSVGAFMRLLPGLPLLALMVAGAGLYLYDGLTALWAAWQVPEYSHGPLIPVISSYLFLRQIKHVPPAEVAMSDRWPGVLFIMLAILVGLAGNIGNIDDVTAYAIIIWVWGTVLISFGWTRGHHLWPPVLHLVFMLPLPGFIYWDVSLALQFLSSEIGVSFIRAMAIPVYLDGNIIDLGVYRLHVAEACSGLRYLFPVMSFTYIFAVLYQGSIWHKVVLLMAAVPLTVLMNSFRIGVIGVMVDNYGIEHAEGFLHLFEGWVIFISVIGLMLLLARAMQWLSGDRRSFAQVLDLDLSGLGGQIARVGDIRPSIPFLTATAMVIAAGLAWHLRPISEPTVVDRESFVLFPGNLEGWSSAGRARLPENVEDILMADDYIAASYLQQGGSVLTPVELFVAWYNNQTPGLYHTPDVCIPAAGWEISAIDRVEIPVQLSDNTVEIPVNRAIIVNGTERQLVYFWFEQRGKRMTSGYEAKIQLIWGGLMTGDYDGSLVRLMTPIAAGEPEAAADERLQAFMPAVMPVLPRFINSSL